MEVYYDDTTGSHRSVSSSSDSHLKYENDRLKKALAQSSANAKKWEAELQTLKNNNAKLTAALQESTMNVEKWREQLNNYKDENSRLKKKAVDLEGSSSNSSATVGALEKGKRDLEQRIQELETRLKIKDEELTAMAQNFTEITTLREKNADISNKVQQLQTDNRRFMQTNLQLEQKVKEAKDSESKLKECKEIETSMRQKVSELSELQQKMSSTLQL